MHTALIEEFKDYLNRHYSSPHTIKAYLRDANEFVSNCSDFSLEEVEVFLSDLFERGLSERTILRKMSSLSVFFEFLKDKGVVKLNVVRMVDKPRPEKYLPKFLDVDETFLLFDNIKSKRDRALLEVIYSAGLRVREVVNLNVEDVDFSNLRLKIKRKGGKVMFVPFGKRAAAILEEYVGDRSRGALFLNRYGNRLSERMVSKIVKKYGLRNIFKDISPHTLRHTKATHLLNSGMDIRLLQRFLGHSSIKTTQIYTHLNLKELASTYDKSHPLANKK